MNNESKLFESASRMMKEGQGNCAQAIFAAYGVHTGLGNVDFDSCMKIASAFGGGINSTRNVCGAITGALMALGLKYGGGNPLEERVTKVATQFLEEFTAINGSLLCSELIDVDFTTKEELMKAYESGAFNKCMKYVDDAARLLDKYIE